MNQIKKRLEIIKIAISMTDSETIRLQLLKLEPFEIDPTLDEIIDLLKMKNYAQAQYLITEYINPTKIIEEEPEKEQSRAKEELQKKRQIQKRYSILEEFQILMPTNKNDEEEEDEDFEEEDNLQITPAHRVLLEIKEDEEEEFDNEDQYLESNRDDIQTEEDEPKMDENETQYDENEAKDEDIREDDNVSEEDDESSNDERDERRKPTPINDIQERFEQIYGVYNFTHVTDTRYQSTKIWITQIKHRGVNENSLQAMLQHIENLKNRDDTSEAAQLICVCAATNLQLGRLLLARELYRGRLIVQDEVEAYKIIHELAEENYNEAICDLGQFYEFGVAVSRNEKKAKELYEKSISLGLKRARTHLERISKKSGIFSKILQ